MAEKADQRPPGVAIRLKKYIPITVEEKLTFTLFRASIADISVTGVRIITSEFLSKGTRWVVTMKANPHLTLTAEVRWVKLDADPNRRSTTAQYQAGLHFVNLGEAERKRLETFVDYERQRAEFA